MSSDDGGHTVGNYPPTVPDDGQELAKALSGDAFFQGLFEAAPDAILLVNVQGEIILLNRPAETLFGYARAELLGQVIEVLLPESLRAAHVAHREAYVKQPRSRPMGSGLNLEGRRKDGSHFPVEISLSPLATPRGLLISSIIRDVSERQQAEATIRKLNSDLEQRVLDRTADLERANLQLVRAEQMAALGQVAAGVAHELRNPLTSIKGLVQVNLRETVARGLPAEDLRIMDQEIRRMERTLQTFLDFARHPKPARRLGSLVPLVNNVLALVAGRAAKQNVAIRFDHAEVVPDLLLDQDQIQQLVLNVVLNALDALPRGGQLTLDLRTTATETVLGFRDNGPGIDATLLPRIFDPFISSKETGLGLGLAISRRIAEDHGGTLAAANRPEGGACFTWTVPLPSTS